jgi:cyclophilin family peptidyl-prolyl cis-trans isomerase
MRFRGWVWAGTVALVCSITFSSCSSGGEAETEAEPASTVQRRAALLDPQGEFWEAQSPSQWQARFETTAGTFVIEVNRDWAPIGADRFYNLVRSGFYDDQRIFRVVADFIAQFGLSGDPEVSAKWIGVTIPDDPVIASNGRGTVAFAMTGPDTRWTQVYINLVDNSRLDEQGFAPFGRVVEGMDAVERIYSGYGENAGGGMRRGNQSRILAEGNVHLDRNFPRLTRIDRVTIVLP